MNAVVMQKETELQNILKYAEEHNFKFIGCILRSDIYLKIYSNSLF